MSNEEKSPEEVITPESIVEKIETPPPQTPPQLIPQRSWKDQLDWMWIIITTVIIILLAVIITGAITLGAILQEDIARRSATYQDLVNKINEQNVKIDLLFNELRKTNLELIEFKTGQ